MRKSLVLLLVIGLLVTVSSIGYANADYELKFGHVGNTSTAYHATAVRFSELIDEYTNGKVKVDIYPNGELGSELDMFEQTKNGTIDFTITAPGQVVEYSDKMGFLSFPFLFEDLEHWKKVMDSEVAEKMKDYVYEDTGVRLVEYLGGITRNVVSRYPIREIKDFEDFQMRIHPTDISLEIWKSLGVNPTTVAWSEIYNALQLGVIDGLENEAFWIMSAKFYEQAPYIIETKNKITIRPIFMSDSTYNELPDELRKDVLKAIEEAGVYGREVGIENDKTAEKELREDYGVEFIEIDQDKIVKNIEGIREKYAKQIGLEELYNKVQELK